jgi:carbon starvation protein CstA
VLTGLPGLKSLMAYMYHFVIMFEALFILTLLETGTRVARFIFQEAYAQLRPTRDGGVAATPWLLNVVMSVAVCVCWGYLLYTGNIDRLWRVFGIANQLLAAIALAIGTSYLLRHAPRRVYALCTGIPFVLVVVTVFTAGIMCIGMWRQELAGLTAQLADPSLARELADKLRPQVFSIEVICALAVAMLAMSALIVASAVRSWVTALRTAAVPQVELVESEVM